MAAVADFNKTPLRVVPTANALGSVVLAGKVVFTTAGAIDTTNSITPRVTPSQVSGGLYRLTLDGGCKALFCTANYYDASGGSDAVTGKVATASTGVIDLTVSAGGTPGAATSGDSLHYIIVAEY